jgi:hypothetical protein
MQDPNLSFLNPNLHDDRLEHVSGVGRLVDSHQDFHAVSLANTSARLSKQELEPESILHSVK